MQSYLMQQTDAHGQSCSGWAEACAEVCVLAPPPEWANESRSRRRTASRWCLRLRPHWLECPDHFVSEAATLREYKFVKTSSINRLDIKLVLLQYKWTLSFFPAWTCSFDFAQCRPVLSERGSATSGRRYAGGHIWESYTIGRKTRLV